MAATSWRRGQGKEKKRERGRKKEAREGEERGLVPKGWPGSVLLEMQWPPGIVGWLHACKVLAVKTFINLIIYTVSPKKPPLFYYPYNFFKN